MTLWQKIAHLLGRPTVPEPKARPSYTLRRDDGSSYETSDPNVGPYVGQYWRNHDHDR